VQQAETVPVDAATETASEQPPQQATPSESPAEPTAEQTTQPAEAIDLVPTVLYPDGYRLVLFYNEGGFYLWNPGDRRLLISGISFEALYDDTGQPAEYRFEGALWAAYYATLFEGRCDSLEIIGGPATSRPAECVGYNASRTPVASSPWLFWVQRDGIRRFRALWDNQEVARCEIATGQCEVYIP
jgi:hypothetical protein